jgi:hypothetical protein
MADRSNRAERRPRVKHHVKAAKALVQGETQRVESRRLGQIKGRQRGAPARLGEDLVVKGLQRALGSGGRDDMGAGLGESQGACAPNAPRGSGDENYSV